MTNTTKSDVNVGSPKLGVTEVLANYVVGDILHHMVTDAVQQAKVTLIDTIGVALAGRKTELVQILSRTHGGRTEGEAMIWASGLRTDAETAAMCNGTAIHALDYDDTNESIRGHLSATIWPTIIALSECMRANGTAMIQAYVVGVRTAVAIADGMVIDSHYARGWHSTSTIGVLAATCAAARLLGLDINKTRYALGLAGSMASGSRQNFGTMTKPLHAGLAARNAVLASRLAEAGFESNASMLEGPIGFYALYEGLGSIDQVEQSLQEQWLPSRHGVSIKNYAVCYNLHRMCDAVLKIQRQDTIFIEQIQKIEVVIEPEGKTPLIYDNPSSLLQCKFSAQFAIAALLLGYNLGPEAFDASLLEDNKLRSLMKLVSVQESVTPPIGSGEWIEGYAVVSIIMKSGEIHCERIDYPKGHWGAPFSSEEIAEKFVQCFPLGLAGANPTEILDDIYGLEHTEHFKMFGKLWS